MCKKSYVNINLIFSTVIGNVEVQTKKQKYFIASLFEAINIK